MAAIVAGNSDMTFNECTARCGSYFALMHCVNGWQEEVSECTVTGGKIHTAKESFLVKSHNVIIDLCDVDIASDMGVLVRSIVNDDPCATKVTGPVYGVNVLLTDMDAKGDLLHEDTAREMWVEMNSSMLTGVIKNAILAMDVGSKWMATADSEVVLASDVDPAQIDAPAGVTITVHGVENAEYALISGGKMIVVAD